MGSFQSLPRGWILCEQQRATWCKPQLGYAPKRQHRPSRGCRGAVQRGQEAAPGVLCSEPFLGWPRSSSRLWICKPQDLHRIPPRPEPLGSSISGRGGGWCCAIPTTRRFGRGQRVGQQNDVWGSDPRTWFSPCSSLLGWSLPCGRSQGGGNPRTRHNSALWKRAQLAKPLAGHVGGPSHIPAPGDCSGVPGPCRSHQIAPGPAGWMLQGLLESKP